MRNTNELEHLQLTGVTLLSLVAYSSGYKKNLLNDFLFFVLPQYCAIMYPDNIQILYLCLAMSIDYSGLKWHEGRDVRKTGVIDYLRFLISIIVGIAIYAADFSIFSKRLGKSHFFGISLMDIGVGSFIYNGGIIGHKNGPRKYMKSCPILIFLGFVRYFTVRWFDIKVNPREYGMHLNFYFLLAFVNIIYSLVKSKYNFLLGLLVITSYEVALKFTSLPHFILSDERRTLLEKNKEGVVAIISYISIFLMATEIGRICLSRDEIKKKALKTIVLSCLFGCLYLVFNLSNEGSRRLGNGSFVFWILTLHSFHVSTYLLLESAFDLCSPLMFRFCSSNMMFVFLFSNLIVLLGNVFFDLKSFSSQAAHLSMLSYLAVVFVVPTLLTSRFDLRWMGLGYRS